MLNESAQNRVKRKTDVLIFANFKLNLWENGCSEQFNNSRGCSFE